MPRVTHRQRKIPAGDVQPPCRRATRCLGALWQFCGIIQPLAFLPSKGHCCGFAGSYKLPPPSARYRLGYWFHSVPTSGRIGYTYANTASSIKTCTSSAEQLDIIISRYTIRRLHMFRELTFVPSYSLDMARTQPRSLTHRESQDEVDSSLKIFMCWKSASSRCSRRNCRSSTRASRGTASW